MTQDLLGHVDEEYSLWRTIREAVSLRSKNGKDAREAMAEKAENAMGFLASKMDEMTWTKIWHAVKAEQRDAHPDMKPSSESFKAMCAARFNEIINKTQVYDSTLSRSQNMRSKSVYMQMATSFAAEGTLTANILMDAVRSKKPKRIITALSVYLVGQVFNALCKGFVTAARDDDEKKTYLEKYVDSATGDLGGWSGSLNPFSLLPIV